MGILDNVDITLKNGDDIMQKSIKDDWELIEVNFFSDSIRSDARHWADIIEHAKLPTAPSWYHVHIGQLFMSYVRHESLNNNFNLDYCNRQIYEDLAHIIDFLWILQNEKGLCYQIHKKINEDIVSCKLNMLTSWIEELLSDHVMIDKYKKMPKAAHNFQICGMTMTKDYIELHISHSICNVNYHMVTCWRSTLTQYNFA